MKMAMSRLAPSVQEYANAFLKIGVSAKQKSILKELYNARKRTITAANIAELVGYESWSGVNAAYGKLAERLCKALKIKPKSGVWVSILVTSTPREPSKDLPLKLRPKIATVLEKLGWVDGRVDANTAPTPRWWVYKCNSNAAQEGDWEYVFTKKHAVQWGSTKTTRYSKQFRQMQPGDYIIAYQTNRQELVGIAQVVQWKPREGREDLYLKVIKEIGVRLPPLKEKFPRIARLKAFAQGFAKTLYDIDEDDARYLIEKAGARFEENGNFDGIDVIAKERVFLEGEKRESTSRSRNPNLRHDAKQKWGTACYCCGFDFKMVHGEIASDYAIVHHLKTFSGIKEPRGATVDDVRVVCANCHAVIHLQEPPIDVDELKARLARGWTPWTKNGVRSRK